MNNVAEENFVKKYIKKSYQDRLLFELKSKKHREKAISRFAHHSKEILKDMIHVKAFGNAQEAVQHFKNVNEMCCVISLDPTDGGSFPVQIAIQNCLDSYSQAILIGETFAFVKEETEKGAPSIYLITV